MTAPARAPYPTSPYRVASALYANGVPGYTEVWTAERGMFLVKQSEYRSVPLGYFVADPAVHIATERTPEDWYQIPETIEEEPMDPNAGIDHEERSFDRWLTMSEEAWNVENLRARLWKLSALTQLCADTMDGYNDTGEFDEALGALASEGVTPSR